MIRQLAFDLPTPEAFRREDFFVSPANATALAALDAAVRAGQVQKGQKLMLEGVGGGFTWGAVLLTF